MSHSDLYLVTGGAGFIGSHVAEALLRRGCRVRIFDNLSSGSERNLTCLRSIKRGRLEVAIGDLRDPREVRRAVRGARYVLHQGALPSVTRSVRDPITTHQVNVDGTLNLLLAAREVGVKRFVFASSSSIYGDSPRLPKDESQPTDPQSPYAVSKLAGEFYCRLFNKLYSMRTVMLRYFNVFGPRQDPASEYAAVIPRFITALLASRAPVIYGNGLQTRDFTYVSDAVQANLKACRLPVRACGVAYNVAGGRQTSLLKLLEILGHLCGTQVKPHFEAPRSGDVRHSRASVALAGRALGYRPSVDLKKGLELTIRSFK